ncbi:MAG TPA: hypothetical protein VH143_24925 [Kofleriaceae bacterium]|nr:hypothetical protein [Kofleriaceae bacterium]
MSAAGEIVLFDRSWYHRAGVERVMGSRSPMTSNTDRVHDPDDARGPISRERRVPGVY